MAIEFGSRRETFENYKVYETMLAGRPFKVEMGKMCGLSNASALIRYGETCVMCNVVMSPKPREGVDFFPLNVEYEEKLYAAGRIPGSFMRREGRPGERAILTSRVVDRPMRPLFPKEMRNDVCITMTVMSLDPDCSPEIAGMIGASLVTAVSDIPWNGPIGGVQVGLVDGEIVLNPTQEQRKVSDLALTVAATMDKIVMIEAGANEVDEDTMLNAIKAAHVEIKKTIEFINRIVAERGKPKIDFQVVGLDMDVFHAIQNKYLDDFKAAMDTDDKNVRDAALLPIMDKIAEEYPDLTAADLDLVSYKMQKFVVRRWLLDEGKRVSELSEGMKVKYQLALAMSHHAKLLILDEPTSGLDPAARDDLLGLFLELVERDGASVLFSTHITSDLDACADTITYIRNGEIFASEARRAFTERYRYLRADEDAVSPELAAKLIAPRRHQGEMEGLLRTADAPEAGSPATLEQIMVHLEREVEA